MSAMLLDKNGGKQPTLVRLLLQPKQATLVFLLVERSEFGGDMEEKLVEATGIRSRKDSMDMTISDNGESGEIQ